MQSHRNFVDPGRARPSVPRHAQRRRALIAAALFAALGSWAVSPAPIPEPAGIQPVRAEELAATSATTVRVRGSIVRYDAATRRLRVSTATGPAEFSVPESAHVIRRGLALDVRELEHLAGSGVVVRYYPDTDGQVTVKSIHILVSSEPLRP